MEDVIIIKKFSGFLFLKKDFDWVDFLLPQLRVNLFVSFERGEYVFYIAHDVHIKKKGTKLKLVLTNREIGRITAADNSLADIDSISALLKGNKVIFKCHDCEVSYSIAGVFEYTPSRNGEKWYAILNLDEKKQREIERNLRLATGK